MTEKDLSGKTVKELRNLAKENNITGRWDMNKTQLIEAILNVSGKNTNSAEDKPQNKDEEQKVESKQDCVKNGKSIENNSKTSAYVDRIQRGMLVAFMYEGKMKSAKVIEKSTKRRKLKLQTKVGIIYVVDYNAVAWVKTGARWPKGVYELLKGKVC